MNPVIELKNYSWQYLRTRQPALNETSWQVEEGAFIGVIGPNGSGKTSLAYSIDGLIPGQYQGIKHGQVEVMGKEVEEYPAGELQHIVGVVFSDPEAQFTAMTVEDELVFGMENLGMTVPQIKDRLEWVLDLTELEPLIDKPPYEISGGQKQRVALAAVLAMMPKIMILDEPTSMLDPISRRKIFEVLAKIKEEQNNTIIVIEHSLENLVPLADRMVLMYRGSLLLEDDTRRFFRQFDLLLQKDVFPPGVISFFHHLIQSGQYSGALPLTVKEAEAGLRSWFANSNHNKSIENRSST